MEFWSHMNDAPRESFTLKATTQTFELTISDLQKLFSQQLGVPEQRISITTRNTFEHGDSIGEGSYVFSGLIVTVKN